MGFSRTLQEYCSGLPCPPPEDLSNPGIEPMSLTSPALAGEFFTTNTPWEACILQYLLLILLIAQAYLHGDFLLFYKLKRELHISLHFLSVLKIYIGIFPRQLIESALILLSIHCFVLFNSL